MVDVVPFEPAHLARLRLRAAQAELQIVLGQPGYGNSLAVPGMAWTGLHAGAVVGCAGIKPQWPGRAIAWALLSDIPRRSWPEITAIVGRQLAAAHLAGYRRIEATVVDGWPTGRRWVERLGFGAVEPPHLMRAYDPEGRDHWLYAKVSS